MGAQLPGGVRSGSRVFDELAGAIGADAALKLCLRFRGGRIYVPKNIAPTDPIAVAIGEEATAKLVNYFSGTWQTLPSGIAIRAAVIRLDAEGQLTKAQIADELHIKERQVYRILADAADDRQGDLFSDPDDE